MSARELHHRPPRRCEWSIGVHVCVCADIDMYLLIVRPTHIRSPLIPGEPSMSTSFQPLENPYLYTFSTETGKIESTCVMPDDFAYTNVMLPL